MPLGLKEQIRDYFTFNRKDRIAILLILVVLMAIFFLPKFFAAGGAVKSANEDTAWMGALAKLEKKQQEADDRPAESDYTASYYQYDRNKNSYSTGGKGELFYFDPNTLSPEGWKKLGLRQRTIQTIQNYISKGGRFKKPEDLQRIYGLFPDEFERIAPYIKIAGNESPARESFKIPEENKLPKTYTPRYVAIDVNAADTTAFISLPGIGSKLSARIVSFRDKLGGFYSINQVAETYGLPDSTFQRIKQYLKLEKTQLKKININTATVDELKAHPYIRYGIANPIIAYRKEHGSFAKIEDVKKVMAVTEEIFAKISPYLIVN